jgi:capsular polysaccharide biosynthesis protein
VTVLRIDSGTGARDVDLFAYLDTDLDEQAHEDSYAWIKALRHMRVDGVSLRSCFTCRGDSLWWFAELYLHKEQVVLRLMRTIAAFDALVARERPLTTALANGQDDGLLAELCRARQIRFTGRSASTRLSVARMDVRARALTAGAFLSRVRAQAPPAARAGVAAFVHRAFWRTDASDGSAEAYIGPVLREIETRVAHGPVHYVGVGPRANFRARRWWHALTRDPVRGVVAIERYAPARALGSARAIWRDRHRIRRALWASADIREHAVIRGCDCWPLIRHQLAGIALLQFPWSVRAMDEAAAALDALAPGVAVTYAEAGGWGRALALECRRREIPLVGLQHGFIYRHWLNYRHEPDEMLPDPVNQGDRGYPRPALTLVFDEYAARHLSTAGRFPPESLRVTGSARLDELVSSVRRMTAARIDDVRMEAGATGDRPLVVLATKQREAARVLPDLIDAVRSLPAVQLAIKPHPAETAAAYADAQAPNVKVLSPSTKLPDLLAAASALVTVNSTVAIDALALGLPSLVIGLPNNLTPFVAAGTMAGARSREEIRATLERLLYDREFRRQLARATDTFVAEFRPAAPSVTDEGGGAAARAAAAVLALSKDH